MLSYLHLAIRFLRSVVRSHLEVALENLALQQQLMVLTRVSRQHNSDFSDRIAMDTFG